MNQEDRWIREHELLLEALTTLQRDVDSTDPNARAGALKIIDQHRDLLERLAR
jgi:hypothetical protein